MHSSSMPHVRHPAPRAHTLSPLAAAVLLLACGTALAQGTPADTSAPKALGEVTIKATPQGDSYTPTATSTATKGSAPLRDVPQAVNVVPAQLLRDQGARSMEDALRNVPGVP